MSPSASRKTWEEREAKKLREWTHARINQLLDTSVDESTPDHRRLELVTEAGALVLSLDMDPREHPAYRVGFLAGVRCAASVAASYETTHPYRLDDVIEMKLNVSHRKRPRKKALR